jgi:DNA-binding NarL/FixJ family response regulator
MKLLLVEDNPALRPALRLGLEVQGVAVAGEAARGEEAVALALALAPDVVLMDVALDGPMNGIEAAVALRREMPRLPVVFYSIADDDDFYRAFRRSGILSHYAYVRKSNYLLPQLLLPLLRDAVAGRSFIDPEIEARVQEVWQRDDQSPMALLEPNERAVVALLAQGLSNEQIAQRLRMRDARAVARTNGQIYTAWSLADTTVDEKVARTRAAIIFREGRLFMWRPDGTMLAQDARGEWAPVDS